MIRAILVVLLLALLVTVVVLVATCGRPPHAEQPPARLSGSATTVLTVLAMLAVGLAIVLAITAGDVWPLLPVAIWIAIYLVVRQRAEPRAHREQQRVEEFDADGVELMERADAAVERIMSSDAATQGWLGDLDFTTDLATIADTLREVTTLRRTAAEWAAIPDATTDDDRMLRDAQHAAAKLKAVAAERVKVLDDCASQAECVDHALHRQREQAAVRQQRDDVGSRLNAMIDGIEMTPTGPSSESTDAVTARVAAFLELRNSSKS